MKIVLVFAIVAIISVVVGHGQYASILAEQLNQYCKTRGPPFSGGGHQKGAVFRTKTGPIGPPGKTNYTLVEKMITEKLSEMTDWKVEIENLKTENKELKILFEETKENFTQEIGYMKVEIRNLKAENKDIEERLNKTEKKQVQEMKAVLKPKDCTSADEESAKSWNGNGGVFDIYPTSSEGIEVYCDTATDCGGWIVFQRRVDGSVDFYRNWDDYVAGFGDINNNFWLGLEKIHRLTSNGNYELRVDMTKWDGEKTFAKYKSFSVGDAASRYRLNVGSYSGTAGDALTHHNGRSFSTKDSDDTTCVKLYKGGWWYVSCYHANLNGVHGVRRSLGGDEGITWRDTRSSSWHPLRWVEMKFRPAT